MKNINLFILGILIAGFISSCEKEIPLTQEEIDPRIVVNSIFSSDDTIWVHLSESRNVLFEDVLPNITNAELKLTDANGSIIGDFIHTEEGLYYCSAPFPIAGSRYGIIASSPGFTSIKAFSDVPKLVNIDSIDTLSSVENYFMEFTVQFQDKVEEKNYYSLSIVRNGYFLNDIDDTIFYSDPYISTNEYFVINGGGGIGEGSEKYATSFYFSDELINGQTINFKAKSYFSPDVDSNSVFVVELRNLSEDLYKYKVTYAKYYETQGSPFAEPVRVYSNVEEGFGIFGGSSAARDTISVN